MCNRYKLAQSKRALSEHFHASEIDTSPRYNIAPTQPVLTVRREQDKKVRKFTLMRWGLIPSWARSMDIGNRTLNARSETVLKTPSFRNSILTKRCLIPADGFYEWKKIGDVKQPYCFEVGEGNLFALAGLWDQWISPAGETIESCTILTTTPNSLVAAMHDRMPVIVPPGKYELWLDPDVTDFNAIRDILKPYEGPMRRYPVSTKLNNSKNEGPESAAAVSLEPPSQDQLFT